MTRCLALVETWRAEGGDAAFLSVCEDYETRWNIEGSGVRSTVFDSAIPDPMDLPWMLATLEELQPDWLVLDGYHLSPRHQQAFRDAGYRLLVIDDTAHWSEYHASILLNPNLDAQALTYTCDRDTTLLLGPRYALLRPRFLDWRTWERRIPQHATRVLVTLGGGDFGNITRKVLEALEQVNVANLEAKVVIGPGNLHVDELHQVVRASNRNVQLLRSVRNMPELMAWADLAVCGGGGTSLELAFMGTPSVILVLAENQQSNARGLENAGVAVNLGWGGEVSPARIAQVMGQVLGLPAARADMARRGRTLVDGHGSQRVLARLRRREIKLRPVSEDDAMMLWRWASDPSVRAASFSSEPIPFEHHMKWLRSKLIDPDCFFEIALNEKGAPVGEVRFDVNGSEAVSSIIVAPSVRGQGYGSAILEVASRRVFQASAATVVHAYVKAGNEASVRAFMNAGFRDAGETTIHSQKAVHLILRR